MAEPIATVGLYLAGKAGDKVVDTAVEWIVLAFTES